MKIIDGNNLILGRVASYVAKAAILGDKIAIVNTDKLVMSGSRSFIIHVRKQIIYHSRSTFDTGPARQAEQRCLLPATA